MTHVHTTPSSLPSTQNIKIRCHNINKVFLQRQRLNDINIKVRNDTRPGASASDVGDIYTRIGVGMWMASCAKVQAVMNNTPSAVGYCSRTLSLLSFPLWFSLCLPPEASLRPALPSHISRHLGGGSQPRDPLHPAFIKADWVRGAEEIWRG